MRKLLIGLAILTSFLMAIVFLWPDSGMGWSIFWAEHSNVREIPTPPADLLAAKARWATNPIKHYGLKVHYSMATYPFVNCWLDMEVINEIIVRIFEDGCSANGYLQRFAPLGRTVTELFAKFQYETTTIHFQEDEGCGFFLSANISYSSAGYPESATYDWSEVSPWTLGPQTYKAMYGDGPRNRSCMDRIDDREPNITVILQPLL